MQGVRRTLGRVAISEAHACVVAAEGTAHGAAVSTGVLRLQPFPPFGDVSQRLQAHSAAVTDLAIEPKGGLVYTCDASGVVLVHAFVQRRAAEAAHEVRSLRCFPLWLGPCWCHA